MRFFVHLALAVIAFSLSSAVLPFVLIGEKTRLPDRTAQNQ